MSFLAHTSWRSASQREARRYLHVVLTGFLGTDVGALTVLGVVWAFNARIHRHPSSLPQRFGWLARALRYKAVVLVQCRFVCASLLFRQNNTGTVPSRNTRHRVLITLVTGFTVDWSALEILLVADNLRHRTVSLVDHRRHLASGFQSRH